MVTQKKRILFEIIVLVAVIVLVVFGGRIERGYYAVASEPFIAVFGALVIWLRRKNKK